MLSIDIHSSKKYYESLFSYPEGVSLEHHPWDGNPFSEYTILRKGEKSLKIYFSVGGYYPNYANKYINEFFS
jgi:hypothetical protein